jgi:hypothetical protein
MAVSIVFFFGGWCWRDKVVWRGGARQHVVLLPLVRWAETSNVLGGQNGW